MLDRFNRRIEYVRVSITDRCNLRCRYCMPECGVEKLAHGDILTYEEIIRTIRLLARLGIRKVRLTGGEPLIRVGIVDLVREIKSIEGIETIMLTTNGVRLEELADDLIRAGLDGINLSLDTLDDETFTMITRRPHLNRVIGGLKEIMRRGVKDIKVNCVPIVGVNDDVERLIELARYDDISVRFIELMPIGTARDFVGMPLSEVRRRIESTFGTLRPLQIDRGLNGPAKYFKLDGFIGRIGFIDAIEDKFCATCNRIRLTAEGFLKLCLSSPRGLDVKALLRDGCNDDEILSRLRQSIYDKPREHYFESGGIDDSRKMYQVGG